MAEDLNRTGEYAFRAPWLKIFSAFKVAFDPKKLLLAGLGVLVMSLGWAVLSWFFYSLGNKPEFDEYESTITAENKPDQENRAFDNFKRYRARYNFRHALAGNPAVVTYKDLGDYAEYARNVNDFREARTFLKVVTINDKTLEIDGKKYVLVGVDDKETGLDKLPKTIERGRLLPLGNQILSVGNVMVKVKVADANNPKEFKELQETLNTKPLSPGALELVRLVERKELKPAGLFRTMPWFENRGPNPYLLVVDSLKPPTSLQEKSPSLASGLVSWVVHDGWPVLLEPLRKFLLPVTYLFKGDDAGGFVNTSYLVSIILFNLAVWGFFGGAITRIALVQLARNEKVGFTEAISFARARWQYYFLAPVLPLVFLTIILAFLWVLGLLFTFTFFVGDVVGGFLWPLPLALGAIMAVALVGLVGWPLMNPTISAEGSDSFDALTRSYSYVYQAPWHYLWYGFLAIVYGAVLVFFVGFMGSLLVYLAKWGVSQASYYQEREPSFLFMDAPTSFGWRDLLLHDSPHRVLEENPTVFTGKYTVKYGAELTLFNRIGIFFVSVWLYFFFLLIVGFGYSFFWTASSVIYLLMRKKIDDTEMDEVYLEEEEPMGFMAPEAPPPPPSSTPGPASTPPGTTFTMVEAPSLRPAAPPESSRPSDGHPEPPPS